MAVGQVTPFKTNSTFLETQKNRTLTCFSSNWSPPKAATQGLIPPVPNAIRLRPIRDRTLKWRDKDAHHVGTKHSCRDAGLWGKREYTRAKICFLFLPCVHLAFFFSPGGIQEEMLGPCCLGRFLFLLSSIYSCVHRVEVDTGGALSHFTQKCRINREILWILIPHVLISRKQNAQIHCNKQKWCQWVQMGHQLSRLLISIQFQRKFLAGMITMVIEIRIHMNVPWNNWFFSTGWTLKH